MLKNFKIKILSFLISILGLSVFWSSIVFAQQLPASSQTGPGSSTVTFNQSNCGDPNYFQYNILVPKSIAGSIYIKLPSGTNPTVVSLYTQQLTGSGCQPIGQGNITVNSKTWTLIGNINLQANAGEVVISGQNIGAEPYAAVANALVVPGGFKCQISTNCIVKYGGYTGYVQPNLISGNTDEIALFTLTDISQSKVKLVNYYSDGTFLYSKPELLPFNNNYLNDGIHSTEIEVNFSDGQKFIVNKTVNNGQSWPGISYLRVLYFKSSNQIKIYMLMALFVVFAAFLIVIARLIHKRLNYKRDHGLNNYHSKYGQSPAVAHHDEIVVKNITD